MTEVDARRIDAMVVGAQKAATTSALSWLGSASNTEVQRYRDLAFFSSDEEFEQGYGSAFAFYFPHVEAEHTKLIAKHANLWSMPKALDRLCSHNPEVHAVVMLRDPVQRAFSAYRWAVAEGWETERVFARALRRGPKGAKNDDEALIRDYLGNGHYAEKLEALLPLLGRDHVSVVFDSEFFADPAAAFGEFASRLGIELTGEPAPRVNESGGQRSRVTGWMLRSDSVRWVSRQVLPRTAARTLRYRIARWNHRPDTETIPAETASWLRNYYSRHDDRLMRLLELDTLPWRQESPCPDLHVQSPPRSAQ